MSAGKRWVLISVTAAIGVLLAANAHLVYVAFESQPDCVVHKKIGGETKPGATLSAARSSC